MLSISELSVFEFHFQTVSHTSTGIFVSVRKNALQKIVVIYLTAQHKYMWFYMWM